jgi:hypothetical protein
MGCVKEPPGVSGPDDHAYGGGDGEVARHFCSHPERVSRR